MTAATIVDPYPDLVRTRIDCIRVRAALRTAGVPVKLISSIERKALKTGRKVTGEHATNRQNRWDVFPTHPQYASERDSRIIFIILCAMMFEFENAPPVPEGMRHLFEAYTQKEIVAGTYKDSLLLEGLDYIRLRDDSLTPVHGYGVYHLGHEDPTRIPKHTPDNVRWRSLRSNLIQGDMTLRQSRIYLIKLIGRYFELGELQIT
jgi:hypothetical protein